MEFNVYNSQPDSRSGPVGELYEASKEVTRETRWPTPLLAMKSSYRIGTGNVGTSSHCIRKEGPIRHRFTCYQRRQDEQAKEDISTNDSKK